MPFKSGLYHLAEQFPQVQLIPTWIDNVQRVMQRARWCRCRSVHGDLRRAAATGRGRGQARVSREGARGGAGPAAEGVMTSLRNLTVDEQVALLFFTLFGLLVLVSVATALYSLRDTPGAQGEALKRFRRDLRAVWVGATAFWLAWSPVRLARRCLRPVLVPGAARVHLAAAHPPQRPPQPDPGLLLRAAVQYAIVATRHFDLFTVFIRSTCSSRSRSSARWPATRTASSSAMPRSSGASSFASTACRTRRHCCCSISRVTRDAARSCCSSWSS